MHGVLKLRKMVQDDPDMGWRERYEARGTEEVVPELATATAPAAAANGMGGDSIQDAAGA